MTNAQLKFLMILTGVLLQTLEVVTQFTPNASVKVSASRTTSYSPSPSLTPWPSITPSLSQQISMPGNDEGLSPLIIGGIAGIGALICCGVIMLLLLLLCMERCCKKQISEDEYLLLLEKDETNPTPLLRVVQAVVSGIPTVPPKNPDESEDSSDDEDEDIVDFPKKLNAGAGNLPVPPDPDESDDSSSDEEIIGFPKKLKIVVPVPPVVNNNNKVDHKQFLLNMAQTVSNLESGVKTLEESVPEVQKNSVETLTRAVEENKQILLVHGNNHVGTLAQNQTQAIFSYLNRLELLGKKLLSLQKFLPDEKVNLEDKNWFNMLANNDEIVDAITLFVNNMEQKSTDNRYITNAGKSGFNHEYTKLASHITMIKLTKGLTATQSQAISDLLDRVEELRRMHNQDLPGGYRLADVNSHFSIN